MAKQKKKKEYKLSTQPYKGARDFYPEDMRIKNYIFDVWRRVPRRFGYEEYDYPILEPFEIFAAKTGEEIVKTQMFSFEDQGGRKLAMRPELTPGTVRMIANKFNELPKPIRWFMIGNNWRYEKPQSGRGREFNQLEVNIFGIKDVIADAEIFEIMIEIMKEFGATEEMFVLYYSDRKLIKALLEEGLRLDEKTAAAVRRIMDKRAKTSDKEFYSGLSKLGLDKEQSKQIDSFLNATIDNLDTAIPTNILEKNQGYQDIKKLSTLLKERGLDKYCEFKPSIIRGFDYSDGIVYEIFDKNPKNPRSLYGGERFDGLIKIFGDYDLPATGVAMGDYTLLEFLKNWDLLPTLSSETQVYVTVFDESTREKSFEIARELRAAGVNTGSDLECGKKLDKQLKYADRKGIPFVIIVGPEEIEKDVVTLKDMKAKAQKQMSLKEAIESIIQN